MLRRTNACLYLFFSLDMVLPKELYSLIRLFAIWDGGGVLAGHLRRLYALVEDKSIKKEDSCTPCISHTSQIILPPPPQHTHTRAHTHTFLEESVILWKNLVEQKVCKNKVFLYHTSRNYCVGQKKSVLRIDSLLSVSQYSFGSFHFNI